MAAADTCQRGNGRIDLGVSIVESIHVLTLCLFLGMATILDLRLLGLVMRDVPVSDVLSRLLPWTTAASC